MLRPAGGVLHALAVCLACFHLTIESCIAIWRRRADFVRKTSCIRVAVAISLFVVVMGALAAEPVAQPGKIKWEPIGLSGGGSMYRESFHPLDPKFLMINSDMSDVFISRDGGHNWDMIPQPQLRSSTYCYPAYHPADPNIIFAAQNGEGMKVTRDKGITWTKVDFPALPAGADGRILQRNLRGEIRIDPANGDRMMAGDDQNVFISTDGGKTWTQCDGPKGITVGFCFDSTSAENRKVIYAATSEGLWRSEDGGKAWTQQPAIAGGRGRKIVSFSGGCDVKTGTMLYASLDPKGEGSPGALYRSSDGGKSWQSIVTGTLCAGQKEARAMQFPYIFTSDKSPRTVVAFNVGLGRMPIDNSAWRSDDAGDTWRSVLSMDYHRDGLNVVGNDYWSKANGQYWTWEPRGVGFDYSDPDRLMRSQSNLIITEDSKTWFYGNTRMAADADPKTGQLATWICNGLVVTTTWNYYIDPFKPDRRYICYTDIRFAISDDHDKTWMFVQPHVPAKWGNTTYELAFEPKTDGKIWAAFSGTHDIPSGNIIQGGHGDNWPGGVGVSTDHGRTWARSNAGLPEKGVVSIVMDPNSPVGNRTLYCSVWKNGVYKSIDDGKTWAKASDGLGDPAQPEHMYPCRIILHNDGSLFVLLTGRKIDNKYYIEKAPGLYKSTDGAKTWQCISKSQFLYWPTEFGVDPDDSKVIYMGASNAKEALQGGTWQTTDGGDTWKRIAQFSSAHFGMYWHPHRKGWLYMTTWGGESGVWLSKDNGKTFKALRGMPFCVGTRVSFDPANDDVIYVSTFGGSVYRGPADE